MEPAARGSDIFSPNAIRGRSHLTAATLFLVLGGFAALDCGGTPGRYSTWCETSVVSRNMEPSGVVNPPSLPSMAGRPLDKGTGRVAFELNPYLLNDPAIPEEDRVHGVVPNWFQQWRLGLHWQKAVSDLLTLGVYTRHTISWLGAPPGGPGEDTPRVDTVLSMLGGGARWNWRADSSPLALSVILELGLRERQNINDVSEHLKTECDTTCYGEARGGYPSPSVDYDEVSLSWALRQTAEDEIALDGSLSVQTSWAVDSWVSLVAISTLQTRSMNDTRSLVAEPGPGLTRLPPHRWETFPVLNLGAGLDVANDKVFAVVLLFFPLEMEPTLDFGPGLTVLAGRRL